MLTIALLLVEYYMFINEKNMKYEVVLLTTFLLSLYYYSVNITHSLDFCQGEISIFLVSELRYVWWQSQQGQEW